MAKQTKTAVKKETSKASAKKTSRKKPTRSFKKGFNRTMADSLWKFVLGNPEHKDWTLDVFKTFCKSDCDDPNDLTILTIDNAVFVNLKNDVSFIVGNTMCLCEHQTTVNPNMPIRCLPYVGMNAAKVIELFRIRVFSELEQWFPTIKCLCF